MLHKKQKYRKKANWKEKEQIFIVIAVSTEAPFIPKREAEDEGDGGKAEKQKLHFKILPISALADYTCECTFIFL